jgi:hypothetical protein
LSSPSSPAKLLHSLVIGSRHAFARYAAQVAAAINRASVSPHGWGAKPRRLGPDCRRCQSPPHHLPPDLARPPLDLADTCSSSKGSAILLAAGAGTSARSLRLPGVIGLGLGTWMAFRSAPPQPLPSWMMPTRRRLRGPCDPVRVVCVAVSSPTVVDPGSIVPNLVVSWPDTIRACHRHSRSSLAPDRL